MRGKALVVAAMLMLFAGLVASTTNVMASIGLGLDPSQAWECGSVFVPIQIEPDSGTAVEAREACEARLAGIAVLASGLVVAGLAALYFGVSSLRSDDGSVSRSVRVALLGFGIFYVVTAGLLVWDSQGLVFWETWSWPWSTPRFSEITSCQDWEIGCGL